MGWVCCCVVHLKGASLLTETSPALCSAHTQVIGAKVKDLETGETFDVSAKVVINAAGPFVDSLCGMADKDYRPMVCVCVCVDVCVCVCVCGFSLSPLNHARGHMVCVCMCCCVVLCRVCV